MGLKAYIAVTILFVLVVFGYLFSLELGDYTISFFDYSATLPVAIWVVLPLVIIVLATYLHIIFYGLLKVIKQKLINKDLDSTIELIKTKLLQNNKKVKFKTKKFKEITNVLNQLELKVKDGNFSSNNDELNQVVSSIKDVNDGKYLSEKEIKFADNSSLAKQNLLNKIDAQIDFAVDVVKKAENYDADVVKHAFKNVLNEKSMTTIKKIYKNITLDKELACELFKKDKENSEFGFENDELIEIIRTLDFKKEDYIRLAKTYKETLDPDKLISLFEKLSNNNEEAVVAYLFVLCEFEMMDKVRDTIAGTKANEFSSFKALLDLREVGKNYTLEELSFK